MPFEKGKKPPGKGKKNAAPADPAPVPAPNHTPVVTTAAAPLVSGATGHVAATDQSLQPSPAEPFKERTVIFPVNFSTMHERGFMLNLVKGQKVTLTEDLVKILNRHGFNF